MTKYLISIIFSLIFFSAFAQVEPTKEEIIKRILTASPDSSRVRLTLVLDSMYLYYSPDTKEILDSALLLATEAQSLSERIKYRSGWEDATFLKANAFAEKQDMKSATGIANTVSGPLRIRILIRISERYIFRPGELKENIDSASPYIESAILSSDSIRSTYWLYESLCIKAKYYFALGNIDSGRACFKHMINETKAEGKTSQEAHWHAELGRYMPHTDSTYDEVVSELLMAVELYHQLHDKRNELDILEVVAFQHKLRPNHLLQAQDELLQSLELRKSMPETEKYIDYTELSEINLAIGNYNKALSYAQFAIKNMEALGHESFAGGQVYSQLANVYRVIGDKRNSLFYFRKALDNLVDFKIEYLFPIAGRIIETLIELDSSGQAFSFLQSFKKRNPATRPIDKELIAASEGRCYEAIGRFDLAERNYLEMIALDATARLHMGKLAAGERSNTITGSEAHYIIGNFYKKQFQDLKAKPYLEQALEFERFAPSVERQINLHDLLFQIDSAESNYLSAIHHQQISQRLRDSVFNSRKIKEISELQIQYASEKREKDLAIIEADSNLKDKELKNSLKVRNITFALIFALLILIGVGYSRYIQKQKSKEEIDLKNKQLQNLVHEKDLFLVEKDNLLEEKETLIREIHHRVKNNLQIVISLLNTQTKYLTSQEAIQAITESRFRMQAMSLLHEKLYQSERSSSVEMRTYIPELIAHLKNSINEGGGVDFQVAVDPVEINLSQAIPLGLIINEAVTNAIKYAFPAPKKGTVTIRLNIVADDVIRLSIQDDGQGFDTGLATINRQSMGMRLIHGLGKQLGGIVAVENTPGVCVSLSFKIERPIENHLLPGEDIETSLD